MPDDRPEPSAADGVRASGTPLAELTAADHRALLRARSARLALPAPVVELDTVFVTAVGTALAALDAARRWSDAGRLGAALGALALADNRSRRVQACGDTLALREQLTALVADLAVPTIAAWRAHADAGARRRLGGAALGASLVTGSVLDDQTLQRTERTHLDLALTYALDPADVRALCPRLTGEQAVRLLAANTRTPWEGDGPGSVVLAPYDGVLALAYLPVRLLAETVVYDDASTLLATIDATIPAEVVHTIAGRPHTASAALVDPATLARADVLALTRVLVAEGRPLEDAYRDAVALTDGSHTR